MARTLRVSLFAALVALMALGGLTIATPDSAAQSVDDMRAVALYESVPLGSACPAGSSSAGSVVAPPGIVGFDATYCRPDGFVPLREQAVCDTLPVPVKWIDEGSRPGVCAYNGWTPPGPASCPAPTRLGEGEDPSGRFGEWCLFEVLIEGSDAAVSAGTPVCIETSLVAETVPTGQVGTRFYSGGLDYLVHTGPPTCEVNCHSGFDFNCDNKLGDFCPVELDLNTVVGVHDCIDGFALAEAEDGDSTVLTESPAPEPADPQVIVLGTDGDAALAHTGNESGLLAYLGLGLVGFGATALGLRRREDLF